jgi:hypothetical protein
MRFDVIAVDLAVRGEDAVRHIPHAFIPVGSVYFRSWV